MMSLAFNVQVDGLAGQLLRELSAPLLLLDAAAPVAWLTVLHVDVFERCRSCSTECVSAQVRQIVLALDSAQCSSA